MLLRPSQGECISLYDRVMTKLADKQTNKTTLAVCKNNHSWKIHTYCNLLAKLNWACFKMPCQTWPWNFTSSLWRQRWITVFFVCYLNRQLIRWFLGRLRQVSPHLFWLGICKVTYSNLWPEVAVSAFLVSGQMAFAQSFAQRSIIE